MFNAVIQSLQSIRTFAYNHFWPRSRTAISQEPIDEYVLVDAPQHGRPRVSAVTSYASLRSVTSRVMPPAPAPTPARTPSSAPLVVAKLMQAPAYAAAIDNINQRVALASYTGIAHVVDNKPSVWTPNVWGFVGSDARFRSCFNEAQAKARQGLDGAASLANELVDNTLIAQPHLSRADVARQVETDLGNKWAESLHGHIMDRYINAAAKANARELPHLRWNAKLVRVQNKFHGELNASAEQVLHKLSILHP